MDLHGIEKSVISLANPWLDFLEGEEAANVRNCLPFPSTGSDC